MYIYTHTHYVYIYIYIYIYIIYIHAYIHAYIHIFLDTSMLKIITMLSMLCMVCCVHVISRMYVFRCLCMLHANIAAHTCMVMYCRGSKMLQKQSYGRFSTSRMHGTWLTAASVRHCVCTDQRCCHPVFFIRDLLVLLWMAPGYYDAMLWHAVGAGRLVALVVLLSVLAAIIIFSLGGADISRQVYLTFLIFQVLSLFRVAWPCLFDCTHFNCLCMWCKLTCVLCVQMQGIEAHLVTSRGSWDGLDR